VVADFVVEETEVVVPVLVGDFTEEDEGLLEHLVEHQRVGFILQQQGLHLLI